MPELAAHLERVAKELAENVVREVLAGVDYAYDLAERAEEIRPILAAALAACAREEAKWWEQRVSGEELNYFREEYDAHKAALERAVGEKG